MPWKSKGSRERKSSSRAYSSSGRGSGNPLAAPFRSSPSSGRGSGNPLATSVRSIAKRNTTRATMDTKKMQKVVKVHTNTHSRARGNMGAPIRLERSVEAWNIDGSSSATPEGTSFIQDAMNATGRRVGRCSFDGCDRPAVVGGHIWIAKREGAKFGRPFIAPICRQCNSPRNTYRMQNAGARLRANIAVTPVSVTQDMRQAERRIV